MYFQDYIWFIIAIAVCMLISLWANAKVHSAYEKYGRVYTRSGMDGYNTALTLLRSNGVYDVSVGRVEGNLTDHYHPKKGVVNLSQGVYANSSVASVAIAAHEVGHVMQNKKGYLFYNFRTALVPIVNIGSRLAMPLVVIGLLIDLLATSADAKTGFYIAMVGVVLYGGAFLFSLITLPVELNASKRAKKMLLESGILYEDEIKGANAVLSSAAFTYLASLLTSFVYFMRFLLYVLTIFGRRNNNRR